MRRTDDTPDAPIAPLDETVIGLGIDRWERPGDMHEIFREFSVRERELHLGNLCKRLGLREIVAIGEGGQAVVYRAKTKGNTSVALKVASSKKVNLVREAGLQDKAFRAGAWTPEVYEAGDEKGLQFILMERLYGSDLKKEKLEKTSPLYTAIAGAQVAESLYKMHEVGVVHRDIKPKNLMQTRGIIQVIDYGVAFSKGDIEARIRRGISGTPMFISPEAYAFQEDERSDQYSLGVTLHVLLTGRTLHDMADEELECFIDSVPKKHRREAMLLQPVIERLLREDPDNRYKTCAHVARDLHKVASYLL